MRGVTFYYTRKDTLIILLNNLVHLKHLEEPQDTKLTCSPLQETWSAARKTLSCLRSRAASVTTRRPSWRRTSSGSSWHCSSPSLRTSVNTPDSKESSTLLPIPPWFHCHSGHFSIIKKRVKFLISLEYYWMQESYSNWLWWILLFDSSMVGVLIQCPDWKVYGYTSDTLSVSEVIQIETAPQLVAYIIWCVFFCFLK